MDPDCWFSGLIFWKKNSFSALFDVMIPKTDNPGNREGNHIGRDNFP